MGTFRQLREAERRRDERLALGALSARRCRVIAVANPKGGVGKTTLVANLAAYLRAHREDLPVLVLSLDAQDGLDRTLGLGAPAPGEPTILDALHSGDLRGATRLGEFGIEYVPSPPSREALADALNGVGALGRLLAARDGLVLVDTGSDAGAPTRAALAQCDLAIMPVRDLESLREAEKLLSLGIPRARAHFVLCGLDLRVKFDAAEQPDVLALLLYEMRVRRLAHFATWISRSPAVEALGTSPDGRRRTVLHGAPHSVVHRQLRALAAEVLAAVDSLPAQQAEPPREPVEVTLARAGGLARWILSDTRR